LLFRPLLEQLTALLSGLLLGLRALLGLWRLLGLLGLLLPALLGGLLELLLGLLELLLGLLHLLLLGLLHLLRLGLLLLLPALLGLLLDLRGLSGLWRLLGLLGHLLPALLGGLLELLLGLLDLSLLGLLDLSLLGLLDLPQLGSLHLLLLALPADELSAGAALGHLVGLLGLAVRRLELLGDLLGDHARGALRTGLSRLLRRQADLLVKLALLLFAHLLVLGGLLNELARPGVTRLQLGLDSLVLAEGLAVAGVGRALICAAARGAREAALLTALYLTLLAVLVRVSLVAHGWSVSGTELVGEPVSLIPSEHRPAGVIIVVVAHYSKLSMR
jgi:hypothetical protein